MIGGDYGRSVETTESSQKQDWNWLQIVLNHSILKKIWLNFNWKSSLNLKIVIFSNQQLVVVLDSGTREPGTRTGTGNFVKNRNRKFEKSPYPEPNRNRLNTRRVPDGS